MKHKTNSWWGKPKIPVKVFGKVKPLAPVKLKIYPGRTRREWKLIDKKPFQDTDRDRVPNIIDCKPLNRNKQSYMLRQEAKRKLLMGTRNIEGGQMPAREYINKIRGGNLSEYKNINRGVATIVPLSLTKKSKIISDNEIKKIKAIQTNDAYGSAAKKKKAVDELLHGPHKVYTERELLHNFEKHPELISLARGAQIKLASPEEEREKFKGISISSGKVLNAAGTGGEYDAHRRIITQSRTAPKTGKNFIENLRHEIKHHVQRKEGYLLYSPREEIEREAVAFAHAPSEREIAREEYAKSGPKEELLESFDKSVEKEEEPIEDIEEAYTEEEDEQGHT